MMEIKFKTDLRDSQETLVKPIKPRDFDLEAYEDYEKSLLENNSKFINADNGLLVYRRVRANGVFYDKCRDYRESLELQLGALASSMEYKADIANFLEPWYGIGYIASCFGSKYLWKNGQAPHTVPLFKSVRELLNSEYIPVEETGEGKQILEMIEYFMDKTKGKVPVSFCDVQSPLNMLTYVVPIHNLFIEVFDSPDELKEAGKLVSGLLASFIKKQENLIGDALAKPGHGFASSRRFEGIALSDDVSVMLSTDDYKNLFQSSDEWLGELFGGCVYHSCGNWEKKIDMVQGIRNIKMADGAFTIETDPSPNSPEIFGDKFAGSGIILNCRAVGNYNNSYEALKKIWRPNQKMIAVTYCRTPGEQRILYDMLHDLNDSHTEGKA